MNNTRWGIIGCGDVTERKSGPAYQKTEGFSIVAVMRRDAVKAEEYAKRHGINRWYSDADALIANPEVDAVYIATPPDTHAFYALKVAAAGKPCCIEKPMAPSYAECLAICEAFESRGLPLFVAYYRRSLPRFRKVKDWIDAGRIGQVRHLHWTLTRTPSPVDLSGNYNWRTDAKIARGGYFDDLACHGLDLFSYFFGDVTDCAGLASNQQGLYDAFDALSATWRYASGVTGTGIWNFGCAQREDEVIIRGERGTITFSVFGDVPFVLETADGREESVIENPENIQLFHVGNMRDHLMGRSQHPSTGRSATETARIMDVILGRT